MKKIIISFVIIFAAFVVKAQTGEIKGKVIDAESKETLPSASVYVTYGNNTIGTITDSDGNFTLKPLNAGVYNLIITYTGYNNYVYEGVRVSSEGITRLPQIALVSGIDLKAVTIKEYLKPLIPSENRIEIIAGDLDKIANNRNIIAALPSFSADITVTENNEVYFRGSRAGDAAYFVDGVKVTEIKVPSTSIKSMMVYTGGVPSKYGDFMGGCVVVETLSYFDWLNMQRAKENKRVSN
ncbi:MAG: carboxypeptidase-like regulatory domain-containing protein [Bacteroidota bacterium]